MQNEQENIDAMSPVAAAPPERVPAVIASDHELLTETGMDAPWEYNQRVYEIWAIYDHWPSGFLMHMAGPCAAGVMIQSVWRTPEHESTYMAEVGVERYTEVARVMTVEGSSPPVDLLPANNKLERLAFGPLAKHFIDIGPDIDGAAAKQFGTQLTAIDIRLPGLSDDERQELWRQLDLVDNVAPELIVRVQLSDDDGLRDTHLWVSEQAARAFVENELLPALSELFGPGADPPVLEFRPIPRLAISSSEIDPQRFDQIS